MYELTVWQGNEVVDWGVKKDVSLVVHPLCLDEQNENGFLSEVIKEKDSDRSEGIDITELYFSGNVKKADRFDYAFAVLSGSLSSAINYIIVGKTDLSKLELDLKDPKQIKPLLIKLMKYYSFSKHQLDQFEIAIDDYLVKAEEKIRYAPEYKKMVIDFANGLSYKALLMSIFSQIVGFRFGKDENEEWTFESIPEKLRTDNVYQAIEVGILSWLINEAVNYKESGRFEDEMKDIIKFAEGLKTAKEMIKKLANSQLLKNKNFDKEELEKWVVDKVKKTDTSEIGTDVAKILVYQALPVAFNKACVRTYYFAKRLISEIKSREVKSVEGLEFIDLFGNYDERERIVTRMDAVSSGIFAAINISYAATKGLAPGSAGWIAFAAGINFVNLFEFVSVIRTDAPYILNDIQEAMNQYEDTQVKKEHIEIDPEVLERVMGLNKNETKILYSLELQKVKEDIDHTKKSELQIKKNQWASEWKDSNAKNLGYAKLFEEDERKLFAMIETQLGNTQKKDWLYRIILELALFEPYTVLNIENKDEYKGLKQTKADYIKNELCERQDAINYDDITEMLKTYEKHYNYLDGKTGKTIAGVAGTLVVSAAAASAAFVFAPAIAVALVGSTFTGLSGAALTSASLALFGGGAIAAGGLGMAGGALVIAGGGALIGLSAAGLTASAFMLLMSPEYVLRDYAKLLTVCDYVLIKQENRLDEVIRIRDMIKNDLDDLIVRMQITQERMNESDLTDDQIKSAKQIIKSIEESKKIIGRSIEDLNKMINRYA